MRLVARTHGSIWGVDAIATRRNESASDSAAQGFSSIPAHEMGTSRSTGTMRNPLGRRPIEQTCKYLQVFCRRHGTRHKVKKQTAENRVTGGLY
jgi:hypothetical protein